MEYEWREAMERVRVERGGGALKSVERGEREYGGSKEKVMKEEGW
jgi:hypothetical protein